MGILEKRNNKEIEKRIVDIYNSIKKVGLIHTDPGRNFPDQYVKILSDSEKECLINPWLDGKKINNEALPKHEILYYYVYTILKEDGEILGNFYKENDYIKKVIKRNHVKEIKWN